MSTPDVARRRNRPAALRSLGSDEGGFTLIELLVVILIIGILAAVALPTFLGQADKGRIATTKSDLRSVATKVEACATDTGTYTGCGTAATGTNVTAAIATGGASYTLTAAKATYKTAHSWTLTGNGSNVGTPTEGTD